MLYRVVSMPTYGFDQFRKSYSPEYDTLEEAQEYLFTLHDIINTPFGIQLDCIMCWVETHE